MRSTHRRSADYEPTLMYNYIANVCIMRFMPYAYARDCMCRYKYMYENCAGGLLDALVIVQYMHVSL